MIDPLAGRRQALNRGEVEVLTWAETTQCPVSKDEVFPLRSCTVQIGHIQRRLIKGKQRWEARVIYHWPDKPRIPASQHGQSHPAQYVNSHHGAVDGIGEEVPTDYQRRIAEEGRLKTVLQGAERRSQAKRLAQETRLAQTHTNGSKRAGKAIERQLRAA